MKNNHSPRDGRSFARLIAILTAAATLTASVAISGCSSSKGMVVDPASILSAQTSAFTADDQTLSGSDVSSADAAGASSTAATTTEAPTTTTAATTLYPVDHEDVFAPNYESKYYIVVYTLNCSTLVLGKDENGKYTKQVKCFLCSPGADNAPTKPGVYEIYRHHPWRYMMQVYGHYCSGFGEGTGYLFHSVPYLEEQNNTLSRRYDDLGTRASHGCVRLCVRDAKWIFENVPFGTQVHVIDNKNGPAGEPVPMRVTGNRYAGWDPTDSDPMNPYNKYPPEDLTYFTHTSAGTQATTVAGQ